MAGQKITREGADRTGDPLLPWDFLTHDLTSEPFHLGSLPPGLSLPLSPAPHGLLLLSPSLSSPLHCHHLAPSSNSSNYPRSPSSSPGTPPPLPVSLLLPPQGLPSQYGHRTRICRWLEPCDSLPKNESPPPNFPAGCVMEKSCK